MDAASFLNIHLKQIESPWRRRHKSLLNVGTIHFYWTIARHNLTAGTVRTLVFIVLYLPKSESSEISSSNSRSLQLELVSEESGSPGPGPCTGPDDSCTTHWGAVQLTLATSDSSPASLLYPFLWPRLEPEQFGTTINQQLTEVRFLCKHYSFAELFK